MAGLFDLLNTVIGKITQNNTTYATAPTPPDGDTSNKVATTAYVQDAVPSIPSGNVAVWSRDFTVSRNSNTRFIVFAPQGGTWFCWGTARGETIDGPKISDIIGSVLSGGAQVCTLSSGSAYMSSASHTMMAIKIA